MPAPTESPWLSSPLALLSLGSRTWFQQGTTGKLEVREVGGTIVVSEEAVAAFYATLHSNSVVKELWIRSGAAFGTPAGAAHLGRCLNLNSALQKLTIYADDYAFGDEAVRRIRRGSGSCWDEAAWTALSEALTSNASIEQVIVWDVPAGSNSHVSATFAEASLKLSALQTVWLIPDEDAPLETATLGCMEGWAHVLKHERCTLAHVNLGLLLPVQGGLVAICEALLTNTTLKRLRIGPWYHGAASIKATVNIEEADAEALAAMLRNNRTLTRLYMRDAGILWNAMVVEQGLSCNSSLKDLGVSLDPDGAHALMTLLQRPGGPITTSTATPASNASSTYPSQLKYLSLGNNKGRGFPTAIALRDLLACNRTLLQLYLYWAQGAVGNNHPPRTRQLPALANNRSLTRLALSWCQGVDGELVYDALLELLESNMCLDNLYDALLELLESNTCLEVINLADTPLDREGKDAVVREQLRANKECRAALKDVPTTLTNSCRLVLCGSPYAGKSTLLNTMMQRHGHGKQRHGWSYYQHIVKKRASAKWLFKDDEKLDLVGEQGGSTFTP